MKTKTIQLDSLNPTGESRVQFIARNPNGDRISIEAHHNDPNTSAPPSVGLGPMEALLAALGACTAVDVQDIMRKRHTPFLTYRLEITGTRSESTPGYYTHIQLNHIGSGKGVTSEQITKAALLSHQKYCSVASSLRQDIVWEIQGLLEN